MKEFKGTKGNEWQVVDHSWSDISLRCDHTIICSHSIYDEATEETQDALETEMGANFQLIASAPELLKCLEMFVNMCYVGASKNEMNELRKEAELVINKALGE